MNKSAEGIVETYLVQEILNRRFLPGEYLPPERVLGERLGYSRPVIHKAIIRLEAKGLVTIKARQGVMVNDYRESGKLDLLDSLYDLYLSGMDLGINRSMLAFVKANLETLLESLCVEGVNEWSVIDFESGEDVFQWIHQFAMLSENVVYAMLFNEFKSGIVNVGDAMVKRQPKAFKNGKLAIETAILEKDVKKLKKKVTQWFLLIEDNWLRGASHA